MHAESHHVASLYTLARTVTSSLGATQPPTLYIDRIITWGIVPGEAEDAVMAAMMRKMQVQFLYNGVTHVYPESQFVQYLIDRKWEKVWGACVG